MAYTIDDWRKSKKYTTDLHEELGVAAGDISFFGLVYRGANGQLSGYIEILGPNFYVLTLNGKEYATYGQRGLEQLEQQLWDDIMATS